MIIDIIKIIIKTAIFQLDPKTIGIGPIKTTPPPFTVVFFLGGKSSDSKSDSNGTIFRVNPNINNKIAIKMKIKPSKGKTPEPAINGKIIKTPPSVSPVKNPTAKKIIPRIKQTNDNI